MKTMNNQEFQSLLTATESEIQLDLRVQALEAILLEIQTTIQTFSQDLEHLRQRPIPLTENDLAIFVSDLNSTLDVTLTEYLHPLQDTQATLNTQLQSAIQAINQLQNSQKLYHQQQNDLKTQINALNERLKSTAHQEHQWLLTIQAMQRNLQTLQTQIEKQDGLLNIHHNDLYDNLGYRKTLSDCQSRIHTLEYVMDRNRNHWFSRFLRHLGMQWQRERRNPKRKRSI
jgi:DNA repair exonuclease SbcCD ATPase subunit